jgi:hypothetical protein
MSVINDPTLYTKPVTFAAGLTLGGGASLGFADGALAGLVSWHPYFIGTSDVLAGTATDNSMPANVFVLGAYFRCTTAVAFTAGTTTGVNLKLGSASTLDAYAANTGIDGVAVNGTKALARGTAAPALHASGPLVLTFTATGASPSLAEVNRAGGTVYVAYVKTPSYVTS